MATVNKSSLRAEFDALKARFESLCAAGKMSADSRALFDALLMLFELLMAVFMEKHTPKSSANSSLPASQSPNDDTARTRPGAKGKGPSSNGERCANTRTREYVKVLSVDACGRCGEDLTDAACLGNLGDLVFSTVERRRGRRDRSGPGPRGVVLLRGSEGGRSGGSAERRKRSEARGEARSRSRLIGTDEVGELTPEDPAEGKRPTG